MTFGEKKNYAKVLSKHFSMEHLFTRVHNIAGLQLCHKLTQKQIEVEANFRFYALFIFYIAWHLTELK